MSTICIQRKHRLPEQELKIRIDSMMKEIQEKLSFQSKWENEQTFRFTRKGAKGQIEISASELKLNLNLGLMYRALTAQIENQIIKAIDLHLN